MHSPLGSSLAVSTAGLSHAELRRTSVSDKQWLGISEDQLINQIFTDKFYHRLQDPAHLWYSQEDTFQSEENDTTPQSHSEQLFLRFLLHSESNPAPISSLLRDLLQYTRGGKTFSRSLKKRIQLVRRIYVAALRERARKQHNTPFISKNNPELETQQHHSYNKQKANVPASLRLVTRMFLATISHHSGAVKGAAVKSLSQMLPEFPLLSLFDDIDDCADALQSFLVQMVGEGSPDTEESKRDAMEALIGLVVTRGTVSGILMTICMLLEEDADNNRVCTVLPFLQRLKNWKITFELSPLIYYKTSWTPIWQEESSPLTFHSFASFTLGKHHIYVHGEYGLLKIGNGQDGTIKGCVYEQNETFYPQQANGRSSLLCIDNLLYFRSPEISPASFVVLDANSLKEMGRIFRDGKGSIPTIDNSRFPIGPELVEYKEIPLADIAISKENIKELRTGQLNCISGEIITKRSHIVTGGRHLFVISQLRRPPYRNDQIVLDKFDTLNHFDHVDRVILCHNEQKSASISPPLTALCMEYGSFYTNEYDLIIYIPSPYAVEYGYDVGQSICRSFSLETGSFIANTLLSGEKKICQVAYDCMNNEIWCLTDSCELGTYTNGGIAPKFLTPSCISSSSIEWHRMGEIELPEGGELSHREIGVFLLRLISRISVLYMPPKRSIHYEYKNKEPFALETNPKIISVLYQLMKQSEDILTKQPNNIVQYEILSYCLRILRLNFYNLIGQPSSTTLCTHKNIPIDLLDNLKKLLLRCIHRIEPTSMIVVSVHQFAKVEACEVLTIGFPLFYASYNSQSNFLLNLFVVEGGQKESNLLLAYILTLLTDRQNSSFLLCPPDDYTFDPDQFLIPIVIRLFHIASYLHRKAPAIPCLPTIEGRSALNLLSSFQKDLLLRVLETTEDSPLPRALMYYSQHIIQQCIQLIESAIEKVVSTSTPHTVKDYINKDPECIVIRILLPNLIHALFLFISNLRLSKNLLPFIVNLICVFDRTNRLGENHLKAAGIKKHSFSTEFIPGSVRISESKHPYSAYSEECVIIHIPGATFLSLRFDEKCNTANSSDFLQIYQDAGMKIPFGERYFEKQWPSNRVVVPGDTAVFCFKSNSVAGFWGYRCAVTGHIPNENATIHSGWSVELQRTLCGLGGKIAANLIRGPKFSTSETNQKALFNNSILFSKGMQYSDCASIYVELFGESVDVLEPKFSPFDDFLHHLCEATPNTDATCLLENAVPPEYYLSKDHDIMRYSMFRVQCFAIAAIIKHHGLISDAITAAKSMKKKQKQTSNHNRSRSISLLRNKPSHPEVWERLSAIISSINNIILQSHQELQFAQSLEEEMNKNNSRANLEQLDKAQSYSLICSDMEEKLSILLRFHAVHETKEWEIQNSTVTKEILAFLRRSVTAKEVQKIITERCNRASCRILGFRSVLNQLQRTKYPGMKHEVLCFLTDALGTKKRKPKPRHYLDNITGCSKILLDHIQISFFALMEHVSTYLEPSIDAGLQLLALNTFGIEYLIQDHEFFSKIHVFDKLYHLMIRGGAKNQFHDRLKELERTYRGEVTTLARNVFYFLGASCVNVAPSQSGPSQIITTWQHSFFDLVSSHLTDYVKQQHCPRCSNTCHCDIANAASHSAMSKQREIEVEYMLGLLCAVSSTEIGHTCLSTADFVKNLTNFLFCERQKIRFYTIQLLHRILPVLPPQLKFGKTTFLSILFDMIGDMLTRFVPDQNDFELRPLQMATLSIMERGGIPSEHILSKNRSSILDLSHPFFDVGFASLPTGWDRTKILHVQNKKFTFSPDNRTVTLTPTPSDDQAQGGESTLPSDIPAFIIADLSVDHTLPFFYFELRMESIGSGTPLLIGLLRCVEEKEGFDFYAIEKNGQKIRPPKEEPYTQSFTNEDVIGCGWYSTTGEVFFTKNGKALGIAFKNVFGVFYPFIGIGSTEATIQANFGQMPFRFDVEPSISLTQSTTSPAVKTATCTTLLSDLIELVRLLLTYPSWNESVQHYVMKGMETAQVIFDAKRRKKKKLFKKQSPLFPLVLSSMAVIGYVGQSIRVGTKVKIHSSVARYGGMEGIVVKKRDKSANLILCGKEEDPTISMPLNLLHVLHANLPPAIQFSNSFLESLFSLTKLVLQPDMGFLLSSYILTNCSRCIHSWIHGQEFPSTLSSLFDSIVPSMRRFQETSVPFFDSRLYVLEDLLDIINTQLFEVLAYGGLLHDGFDPSWSIHDQGNRCPDTHIQIGGWYSVVKRGNGSEWVQEMNDTVSYIGCVTMIDSNLSLAKLKFFDPETGATVEWWYSLSDLAPCPTSEIQWPFINPSTTIEAANQSKIEISTSISIFHCRDILVYYYCGKMNGIHPKIDRSSIQDIVRLVKLHVWRAPCPKGVDSLAQVHGRYSTVELRALQLHVIQNVQKLPLEYQVKEKKERAGFLLKRSKRFRTWTKLYFFTHEGSVYYQRFQSSSSPLGSISLDDVIHTEERGGRVFRVVTSSSEYLLQAYSSNTTQTWLRLFSSKLWMPGSVEKSTKEASFLTSALTDSIISNFKQSTNNVLPNIVVESEHPYKRQSVKKIIQIPGADNLLVLFDHSSSIKSGDVLNFYTAGIGIPKELIRSYSGKGRSIFSVPFIVPNNRMWMHFDMKTLSNSSIGHQEWGFKFFVYPTRMKISDSYLLPSGSFDFAYCVAEWMLHISPVYVSELYCVEMYDALVVHVNERVPLYQKVQAINLLIPIVQRINLFEQSPDLSKLQKIREDLFRLVQSEQTSSGLHSEFVQRLFELMINCYIVSGGKTFESALHTIEPRENDFFDSLDELSFSEITEGSEFSESSLKFTIHLNDDDHALNNPDSYPPWFRTMIKTVMVLKQLLEGDSFPSDFIQEACYQSHKATVIQESPHPYPAGARVTATVSIPHASSLLVTFHSKSITEEGVDHLLFSRGSIGSDDLGAFSGIFGDKQLLIPGNTFVWSFLSDSSPSSNALWGFRFTVEPNFDENTNFQLQQLGEKDYQMTLASKSNWTLSMDYDLVSIIEATCEKLSVKAQDISWKDLADRCSIFRLPLEMVRQRFILLMYLNRKVSCMLPLVDMRYVNEDSSIAFMIGSTRRLLFYDIKMDVLEEALTATRSNRISPVVEFDRLHAHTTPHNCLFLQGFRLLHHLDPELLRQTDRAWTVKLLQEGAMDVGGPYREILSDFCSDLLSKDLNLFLRCPNAASEMGFNQDKFIPNPAATSVQQLKYFAFIGKLMGIAIRTKSSLDLALPSIVWKPLVFTKLESSDLEAVDQSCCKYLEAIRDLEHSEVTPETFYDLIFENFTTTSSDGRTVELKPGGSNCQVTWENRCQFVSLVEQYRLNEFKLQTEAIAEGIRSIVPSHLLALFSWQQLERRVCGDAKFDIELLKRNTVYVSVSPSQAHIQMFWEVLEGFAPKEKELFIRFVWGRSQLPRESEFTTPFQLQAFPSLAHNQDDLLPMAQTCFFSVSLPVYSSAQIMRQRLLYAITTCREIDSDFVVPDGEFTIQ